MKRYDQKPHTCPACLGTGEEQYDTVLADDATAIYSAGNPECFRTVDNEACTACGGEGLVYERLNVFEVADDFINDEYLMTLQMEVAI